MRINKASWLCFLVLSALVAGVYSSGLSGAFNFDDDANIISNPFLRMYQFSWDGLTAAANSGVSGPLGRPLAMASFALNHYLSGDFDPASMKFTNLLIHLFTACALFQLTHILVARAITTNLLKVADPQLVRNWAPLVVAFVWMVHPANLTPVLYVVQRMTSMSALFCLLGMIFYALGRERQLERGKGAWLQILLAYLVFLPLAIYSKENGALLPVYLLLIEITFYQFRVSESASAQMRFNAVHYLHGMLCVLPALGIVLFLLANPAWLQHSYENRDFTLLERLLTEARVLFLYLKLTWRPLITDMALFHDGFAISRGLLNPATTLFAVLGLGGAALTALVLRRRLPLVFFAVFFFFAAHSMESSLLGLELIHEHRNYLASWPLLFVPLLYLMANIGRPQSLRIGVLAFVILALILSFQTWQRASIWGNQILHALTEVENHPNSARANYQAGRVYAFLANREQDPTLKASYIEKVQSYFSASASMNRNNTDAMFGLLMLNGIEGVALSPAWRTRFLETLQTPPFAANNYNYLQAMFLCISDGACDWNTELVNSVIAASASNPNFKGLPAEQVFLVYQEYLLNSGQAERADEAELK